MSVFTRQSLDRHADFYDEGLGPVLFEAYARDLAARVAAQGPRRVLDLAAGTGILTRALRDRLPRAILTITDIDRAMLARARSRLGNAAEVERADCSALPFEDALFDAAACQFGAALFPRKADAFQEVARIVRPGGTYAFNCWGPVAENPYAEVAGAVVARFLGGRLPEAWTAPFAYADPRHVTRDLRAAGWCRIAVERVAMSAHVADAAAFARGLVLGAPVVCDLREAGVEPGEVVAAVAGALTAAFGAAPFAMPLTATVYTCHTP
ncbi:MAG: methyltransferase type 11 [Rhodovulum sulfidophilum]|uniref:Methyltransferase type 11 n=1 Tax=Rhodovulum sulfidophilum TaxID=35806 RepID=A0A2W5PW29_RHOSU|nr:MAG: methyltransferase type 11 [Rhodovulum sulfidophilum]